MSEGPNFKAGTSFEASCQIPASSPSRSFAEVLTLLSLPSNSIVIESGGSETSMVNLEVSMSAYFVGVIEMRFEPLLTLTITAT